jgi:hypothetical protein
MGNRKTSNKCHPLLYTVIFLLLPLVIACSNDVKTFPNENISTPSNSTISGFVYDANSGDPISGATITTDPETVSAVSATDGSFLLILNTYSENTFDLVVTKDGYPTTRVDDVLLATDTTTEISVSLYNQAGVVSGTVTSSKGNSLTDVTVTATSGSDTIQTKSDDKGSFVLENLLVSSQYTLSFSHKEPQYCTNEKTSLSVLENNFQINIVLSGKPLTASTYKGSTSCLSCHGKKNTQHSITAHANVIKTPNQINAQAYDSFVNNHSITLDPYLFTLSQDSEDNLQITIQGTNTYTIDKIYGGHFWKENYITKIGTQNFVLPLAWSLKEQDFILDETQIANWFDANNNVITPTSSTSYEQNCLGCHVSGFKISYDQNKITSQSTAKATLPYLDDHVSCERCHGPGSTHIDKAQTGQTDSSLYIVQPRYLSVKNNLQVCGQCHAKGTAKKFTATTIPYPVDENGNSYQPGDNLDDYLNYDDNNWADTTYSKGFHQEYSDYKNTKHATNKRYQLRCSDCHDGHASLKQPAQNNTLCLGCHRLTDFPSTYSIQVHTQHSYDPDNSGASRCTGCHMTKTGSVAHQSDVGGHGFVSLNPKTSLSQLQEGKDPIPNPCITCHNKYPSQNVLAGDITNEDYLTLLSASYDAKYEEAKQDGSIASYTHETAPDWMNKNSSKNHGNYYLKSPSSCLNSCHGDNLSGGLLENGSSVPSCWSCHYSYPHDKRLELDGIGDQNWQNSHAPYYSDTDCKTCHGDDYTTVINDTSCTSCHASPGENFSQFTDATCANQLCHEAPPTSDAHASHYVGLYPEHSEAPFYGETTNLSTKDDYRFGCGTCHPINTSKHRNKVVDVELYNETADPQSIKALMDPLAHYDTVTKTCSNTYCHSKTDYVGSGGASIKVPFPVSFTDPSGMLNDIDTIVATFNGDNYKTISSYFVWNHFSAPENHKEAYYWSLPSLWSLDELCNSGSTQTLCQGGVDVNGVAVFDYDPNNFGYKITYPLNTEINQVRRYQTTPAWDSMEKLTCNSCHSYPPRSSLTDDEWDSNDPNWENHAPTILNEAAIDKHSFIFPKLASNSETIEVGHMANMKPYSQAPLRCQVCHFQTSEKLNLAAWETGTGWHLDEKGIIQLDNMAIADKTAHVNGFVDVDFDQSFSVTSYKFNDEFYPYTLRAFPEPISSSGLTFNFANNYLGKVPFYGLNENNNPGASWNPVTKTCSNVSCHLEQSHVSWTAPYRPHSEAECSQCHQYHSDPTPLKSDDATMCWPHAPHNGCEHKLPLKKEFNGF